MDPYGLLELTHESQAKTATLLIHGRHMCEVRGESLGVVTTDTPLPTPYPQPTSLPHPLGRFLPTQLMARVGQLIFNINHNLQG